MSATDRIQDYIQDQTARHDNASPIFSIVVFENPDKELIYENGKHSGWPDTGCMSEMGFYYDLETAIQAMHENWADIHETCYHAGFVICRYPGLYNVAVPEGRIYFVWDESRGGFYETEEPEIFAHVAY